MAEARLDATAEAAVRKVEEEIAPYSNYLTRAENPSAVHLTFVDLATSAAQLVSWAIGLYLGTYLPERAKRDAAAPSTETSEKDAKAELADAVREIKALKGRVAMLEMQQGIAALEVEVAGKLRDMGLSERAAARAAQALMPTLQDMLPKMAGIDGAS